jgi:hypothetical protein
VYQAKGYFIEKLYATIHVENEHPALKGRVFIFSALFAANFYLFFLISLLISMAFDHRFVSPTLRLHSMRRPSGLRLIFTSFCLVFA